MSLPPMPEPRYNQDNVYIPRYYSTDYMKQFVLASETATLSIREIANPTGKTHGDICNEAMRKVDEYCHEGKLGLIYHSIVTDPDKGN